MKRIICFIALVAVCFFACKKLPNATTGHLKGKVVGTMGKEAMVVTAHPEASKVGKAILEKGGNAIDAAVAVKFALAVVYPRAGNIGGGGFMVYRAADGTATTLDFREKAPLAAHRDLYLDSLGNVIPRLSIDGHLAVGVPGTVDGMVEAHKQYGQLLWEDLLQPAIDLAEKGYLLTGGLADYLNRFQEDFEAFNTTATYFQKEMDWKVGELFVQEDLAETLKLIRDNGRDGFYKGRTAQLFLEEMQRGNGIITQEDLDAYQSVWRKPIKKNYGKEYRIISMGPPSSGGIALLQMAEMMARFPLAEWGFQDARTAHVMIEAERLAYADRATHLGDADFYPVPMIGLLTDTYIQIRANQIDVEKARRSSKVTAGNPPGSAGKTKNVLGKESNETTHFSIVDAAGNAVSLTTTLNGNYGSKVFVDKAGFLLNNEMDDFSAKPGVPNMFGLVGNEANSIVAEKRMLSSMTPTIIEKNGDLFMVLGSPGGATIITSVFQCMLNVTEFDMTMQEAVNAPRFHHQWLPDTVFIEKEAFDVETLATLKEMGHFFQERGSGIERRTIGKVDAILVWENGMIEGAADGRGEDSAMGF